jgi:hypothetical protein
MTRFEYHNRRDIKLICEVSLQWSFCFFIETLRIDSNVFGHVFWWWYITSMMFIKQDKVVCFPRHSERMRRIVITILKGPSTFGTQKSSWTSPTVRIKSTNTELLHWFRTRWIPVASAWPISTSEGFLRNEVRNCRLHLTQCLNSLCMDLVVFDALPWKENLWFEASLI